MKIQFIALLILFSAPVVASVKRALASATCNNYRVFTFKEYGISFLWVDL